MLYIEVIYKVNSIPLGWTDDNTVTITKHTRVPKKPPRIEVLKSSNQHEFKRDLAVVPRELGYLENILTDSTLNRGDGVLCSS